MEDIVRSDCIFFWSQALHGNAVHRNEQIILRCDGTMKICMVVQGFHSSRIARILLARLSSTRNAPPVTLFSGWWSTGARPPASGAEVGIPHLRSTWLGTVHLVMKYKPAFRHHESPGSTMSRGV